MSLDELVLEADAYEALQAAMEAHASPSVARAWVATQTDLDNDPAEAVDLFSIQLTLCGARRVWLQLDETLRVMLERRPRGVFDGVLQLAEARLAVLSVDGVRCAPPACVSYQMTADGLAGCVDDGALLRPWRGDAPAWASFELVSRAPDGSQRVRVDKHGEGTLAGELSGAMRQPVRFDASTGSMEFDLRPDVGAARIFLITNSAVLNRRMQERPLPHNLSSSGGEQ